MSNITQQLAANRNLIKHCCKEVPSLWREDAEQVASLAFVKAVESYQEGGGSKFSSWACTWMRRAVMDFCRKNIPPIETVPIEGMDFVYDKEVFHKDDLKYLLRQIPQFQASRVILSLRGDRFLSRSDASIKAAGVHSLRRVFKKEFDKIK